MRARIVVLAIWLLLFGRAWVSAADFASNWDALASRSIFLEFVATNQDSIVNLTNVDSVDRAEIRGLEVSDAPLADWSTLGQRLTNVVCLRVTSSAADLSTAFFSAITNYPRLEYLHLQCRQTPTVSPHVNLLTNLLHLRYLGIDAPSATSIDSGIYQIGTLKELFLVVGAARLPDGIARLHKLTRMEIHGRRATPVRSLPADLPKSAIRQLEIANIPGVEKLLPVLPPDLVELSVLKCQLRAIPNAWLENHELQLVDFSNNALTNFPIGLLSIPSLKLVGLDLNNITNVPSLKLADDRQLKITLIANPIRHFASDNQPLVERGVIEK